VDRSQLDGPEAAAASPDLGLLAAIVSSSDDAIVGVNLNGMITSWNPAAERIFGYSAHEVTGQSATILCPDDRMAEFTAALGAIARGEHVAHYHTMRLRKGVSAIPVSVTVSPVRENSGKLIGYSSIARDITDQRLAESDLRRQTAELERINRNLAAFSYTVSHDLLAPLGAVTGYSDALLDECRDVLGDTGRGYAERIRAVSEQMKALIDDLLRISLVTQAELHLEAVDLSAEIAASADELRDREPGRRVSITIQDGVWVRTDRSLIRAALRNLLDNAWKFTSRRDLALIEFGTIPAASGRVCCYVRDNGAGFDRAYADQLFRPFQRLHTAREFPGHGIGLASVKQIAERLGGQVRAESGPGTGATFYLVLDSKDIT
jgi:PAS domain S-box-containing protein